MSLTSMFPKDFFEALKMLTCLVDTVFGTTNFVASFMEAANHSF